MFKGAGGLGQPQVARVTFAVKRDEAAGPVRKAPARFGPTEVGEGGLTQSVEQTGRLGRGGGERSR